jgi:hypothetical protein
MRRSIESASRWRVTGLVVNTHLMDDTTADVVTDGWRLAAAVRSETGLPIRAVGVMDRVAELLNPDAIDAPILRMRRHMLPPWIQADAAEVTTSADAGTLPAPRPIPLGKPRPMTVASPQGDPHGSNQY